MHSFDPRTKPLQVSHAPVVKLVQSMLFDHATNPSFKTSSVYISVNKIVAFTITVFIKTGSSLLKSFVLVEGDIMKYCQHGCGYCF